MRGHVRKRGAKWCVVVDVGRDPVTNKRRQKWHSGYDRKKDAETKLSEILTSLDGQSYVEPSKLTVGEFLTDRWLPTVRSAVRDTTYDSYAKNVRLHVVPALGSVPVQRLTGDQLTRLYGKLLAEGSPNGKGPLSTRTTRYVHAIVRHALADAVRWGLVTRNVAETADPPRAQRNRQAMRTWTADQLRAFLASRSDDRLYAMWLLAASTGMRRGEVLGLSWDAVDLDAGRLEVRRALTAVGYKLHWTEPKTGKGRRSVALDPATVEALKAHRKAQLEERLALGPAWVDNGLVFCREDGEPIHPDRFSKVFGQHVKALGLPRIRLHDLRHTHATLALRANVHAKVVQERLGHASIALTLDTYSHAIPAMQEDAAAKVAALVLGEA